MKVRFYVEKRRDEHGKLMEADRPIFMSVSFHGNRMMISTGQKVDRHWWDPGKQRIRDEHPEAVVLNSWLDSLKVTASATWIALASLSERPGVEDFRREFQRLKPRFSHGFFEVFYLFMEEGNERWSSATYKKVRTVYNLLKSFEEQGERNLTFASMDREFLESFRDFCDQRQLKPISQFKTINVLVWYLNWSTEKGFNIYRDYRDFYKLIRLEERPEKVKRLYLDWNDLMRLYQLQLKTPMMERARDLYCLMCFTGIRYAELSSLKKEHLEPHRIIVRRPRGKTRIIRINKFARTIVDRYENKYYRGNAALPVMSAVTLNKYVRIAAKEAGIEKHAELTAGSAVTTFIMNALRLDIPPEVIAGYTGVKHDVRVRMLQQEMENRHMEKFNALEND